MYNSNLLVNSPAMASGAHRCTKCHMTFNSPHLLSKHQTKFCVGGTGDPDDLLLRRGLWSADSPRRDSPDFDRDSYRRYDPNQDQQLRYLAENHGRQMEYLQLRNKDLEKQREDIRKQLEGLGKRPPPSDRDSTAELLRELKEQEERNQRALEDLRRQLYGLNNQRVNVIEVEKQVQPMVVQAPAPPPPPPPPPPAPAPEPPKKNFIFPVPYHGSSLVAEICAIRQAYIQNGGNDPEVLYQMSKMQADAQAIEDQMKNRQPEKPKEKPKDHTGQFNYLEMENERLHRELMLLQEQNALSQNRRKSDKEGNNRSRDHSNVKSRKSDSRQSKHQKSVSNKTVSLVPDEQLIEDIEKDAENMSIKSYHSEPAKKPRQKIVYYKAYHHPNGGFHVEKAPTSEVRFENQVGQQVTRNDMARRPTRVPPLDLRDISSPSDQRFGKVLKRQSNKENQPYYPAQNLYSEWDNFPAIQKPQSLYNSQPAKATDPGLQYSKSFVEPSHFKPVNRNEQISTKPTIIGFHGIIDPNEYTFYKPISHVEEPHRHKSRKVKAPKNYKPVVKPVSPRQHVEMNPSNDENLNTSEGNADQNEILNEHQQNGVIENPQETSGQQPDPTNYNEPQQQLPSNTETSQQQLPSKVYPSNMIDNEDDDEIEYTPAGSPITEESEEEFTLDLHKYDIGSY